MKIIDISGSIYTNMWSYADYYPQFELSAVEFEFSGETYSVDVFKGMHAQTGSYIETPSIFGGVKKVSHVIDIPLEKLFMIDVYIIQVEHKKLGIKDGLPFITKEDLVKGEKEEIPEGAAILVSSGYGENYREKDYAQKGWFFKKEALYHLIDKKPLLIGSDSPSWENPANPEGAFDRFYKSGILLLDPLVNLEKVKNFKAKLTVLPLKIENVAVCPVRAIITEEK
ncbi:cyclase family protein [Actinomycetota bacterium]